MSPIITLVVGASENPARYSYMAVERLTQHGHPVIALGKKAGFIGKIPIETERKQFSEIHTITLYINPQIQQSYYEYLLALNPERIIFNPGTENTEFVNIARAKGIKTIEACTLVMLSTGQY